MDCISLGNNYYLPNIYRMAAKRFHRQKLSEGAFGCGWMIILIMLGIGFVLGSRLMCNRKEAMSMGAPLDWVMGQGQPNNWVQGAQDYNSSMGGTLGSVESKHASYTGTPVPLPDGELFMFADNKVSPSCCNSATYSSSGGCVCTTLEQLKYINKRGGNRTEGYF